MVTPIQGGQFPLQPIARSAAECGSGAYQPVLKPADDSVHRLGGRRPRKLSKLLQAQRALGAEAGQAVCQVAYLGLHPERTTTGFHRQQSLAVNCRLCASQESLSPYPPALSGAAGEQIHQAHTSNLGATRPRQHHSGFGIRRTVVVPGLQRGCVLVAN